MPDAPSLLIGTEGFPIRGNPRAEHPQLLTPYAPEGLEALVDAAAEQVLAVEPWQLDGSRWVSQWRLRGDQRLLLTITDLFARVELVHVPLPATRWSIRPLLYIGVAGFDLARFELEGFCRRLLVSNLVLEYMGAFELDGHPDQWLDELKEAFSEVREARQPGESKEGGRA